MAGHEGGDVVEIPPPPGKRRPRSGTIFDPAAAYCSVPARVPRWLLETVDGLDTLLALPPTTDGAVVADDAGPTPQRIRHAKSFAKHFGDLVEPKVAELIIRHGVKAPSYLNDIYREFEDEYPERNEHFLYLFRHGAIRGSSVPYNAFVYAARNAQRLYWGGWPKSDWSSCAICGLRFLPSSELGFEDRVGAIGRYCQVCLARPWWYSNEPIPKAPLLARRLRGATNGFGFLPQENSLSSVTLAALDDGSADRLMAAAMVMPSPQHLYSAFGRPWTRVLLSTGVIQDARETPRGVATIARDGHFCRSMGERMIDDFLDAHGLRHEPEPKWPGHPTLNASGRLRADWLLEDGTLIEYAGLTGEKSYDEKIARKRRLASVLGIDLVVVYPSDLVRLGDVFSRFIDR